MRTIREALTAAGDIYPGDGELLIRIDTLTAPRRTQALAVIGIPHISGAHPQPSLQRSSAGHDEKDRP